MANIIYEKSKIVFVHLPKCGGSSIKHKRLFEERSAMYLGCVPDAKYNDFNSFTIVRNPYTRFASVYRMHKYGTSDLPKSKRIKSIDDLLDILYNEKISKGPVGKIMSFNPASDEEGVKHHAIAQTDPYNTLDYAKRIARFENYTDDLSKILKDFGVKFNKTKHHNMSLKKDIPLILKDKHLEMVNDYYAKDFEILGYKKENKEVIL